MDCSEVITNTVFVNQAITPVEWFLMTVGALAICAAIMWLITTWFQPGGV